ncbi:MAG: tetratricopeptide repeat protein [Sandaracinaceae bacterium]
MVARRRTRTERGLLVRADEPPANEDFLFHLSRGSEYLVQDRVMEAKLELEQALAHQPLDAQGQDLLAGVYFRLGVYGTAIELWERLIEDFPEDVTLRVNVGLALLKTGQPARARQHLATAIDQDPTHARAWSYLGLAFWRAGDLERAREAFLSGGQLSMARRMEEASAAATEPVLVPPPPPRPDADVSAVRDAARDALSQLEVDGLRVAPHGRDVAEGAWAVRETGAAPVEPTVRVEPRHAPGPPRLEALVDDWVAVPAPAAPMAVGPRGDLLLQSRGALHFRRRHLAAVRCEGRIEPFEGPGGAGARASDALLRWGGPVLAVLAPPGSGQYCCARLGQRGLVVREALVEAFDDRVVWERESVDGAEDVRLLSFRGEGVIALHLPRSPAAVEVDGREVGVDPARLLGWIGRLALSPPRAAALGLSVRGRGVLLLR